MGTHPCMSGGPCQCGGNCGCTARELEAAWFSKTAADIRRVLSQILFPLQPHVKDFNKVLLEFSDALYGAVEEEPEIVKYDVRTTYATAWGKTTYGGWEDPPETDEMEVDVPASFDLTCKVSVDFKVFIKSVMRYAKSQITDKRGFEAALKGILSNSNASNMIGKLLKDRFAHLIKTDPDMITDSSDLDDILRDETTQEVDVESYGRPENPKAGKTWFKTTSRGVDLYCQVKVDVSDDWELSIDYEYGRDYEAEWEARPRWAMDKTSLEQAWFEKASTKTAASRKDFERAIQRERGLKHYTQDTIENVAYAMSEWNDHRDPEDGDELNDYADELMDDIHDNTHDGDQKIDLRREEKDLLKAFAKARRFRMATRLGYDA